MMASNSVFNVRPSNFFAVLVVDDLIIRGTVNLPSGEDQVNLTSTGQLLTSNGSSEVALDPGTNGQVLTVNTSSEEGIQWANLPTTQAGSAEYGVIIGTTPQNGTGTISIGYGAGSSQSDATNCIVIGTNSNCGNGTSNTVLMGTGTTTGVSNEFNLPQIEHFNIPNLTTSSDGTGTLVQYGGANSGWVQASGGTYNSVEKIDNIISTLQGQLPSEIIFTTISTNPPIETWTVPVGVNSLTIEASGSGAPGTPAIASSTSGVYQGGGGGGSGQVGNITIPVVEGMELTISLGAATPPGTTIAYGTAVSINGARIITCNGATANTSGMNGGNGATLGPGVFGSYSCGGGGGMNYSGGESTTLGSGGTGSVSTFNGSASAVWGSSITVNGNVVYKTSGNGGLNNNGSPPLAGPDGNNPSGVPGAGGGTLGGTYLSLNTDGRMGCGGCGGFGMSGSLIPPGSGGGGYVKLRLGF
jgi:hypothetical protein